MSISLMPDWWHGITHRGTTGHTSLVLMSWSNIESSHVCNNIVTSHSNNCPSVAAEHTMTWLCSLTGVLAHVVLGWLNLTGVLAHVALGCIKCLTQRTHRRWYSNWSTSMTPLSSQYVYILQDHVILCKIMWSDYGICAKCKLLHNQDTCSCSHKAITLPAVCMYTQINRPWNQDTTV